jgi:hypothetical protein
MLSRLRRGLLASAGTFGFFPAGEGAGALLVGETQGFTIDATTYDTVGNYPLYTGGPVGGTVACVNLSDSSDNLNNVALNASPLVNTGTSPKMVHWNEAPYVRWTPHNSYIRSQELDNASVTKTRASVTANAAVAPDGTTTADFLKEDATAANTHQFHSGGLTIQAGAIYTVSVYAKQAVGSRQFGFVSVETSAFTHGFYIYGDLENGTVTEADVSGSGTLVDYGMEDAGNGWYRIWASGTYSTLTTAETYFRLNEDGTIAGQTYDGDNTSGVYSWGHQFNRGIEPTPYVATTTAAKIGIPQTYDAYEDCFAIRSEDAATNLLLQSQTFDNASWTNGNSSETANTHTAPDGTTTADTITSDGTLGSNIRQSVTTSSGSAYTASCYLKAGTTDWVFLQLSDLVDDSAGAYFNLATGEVGTEATDGTWTHTASPTITAIGNGWYRCTVTTTVNVVSTTCRILHSDGDGDVDVAIDDTVIVWGAQVELGTVATSYIPTVTSTVTRAEDNISWAVASTPYSATNGTVWSDSKLVMNDATLNVATIWSVYEDASDRIGVYGDGTNWRFFCVNGGSTVVHGTLNPQVMDTRTQISYAFKTNDHDASQDGGALVTDETGTLSDLSNDNFYLGRDGAACVSGHLIYRLVYVPRQVETDG